MAAASKQNRKKNIAGKRVSLLSSLQTIQRVARVPPQRFKTCATRTPSLIPSLPTPERGECFVWQSETGMASTARYCTASQPMQHNHRVSVYANRSGPQQHGRPVSLWLKYLSKVLFCSPEGSAAAHWSERRVRTGAGCDVSHPARGT